MSKLSYRDAGLDLDLYEQSLACMAPLLKRTHTPRVLDGFGGFASLFSLDYNCRLFAKNRSEEHTSELQSHLNLVCRLLLEKKNKDALLAPTATAPAGLP